MILKILYNPFILGILVSGCNSVRLGSHLCGALTQSMLMCVSLPINVYCIKAGHSFDRSP